jgi:integrase
MTLLGEIFQQPKTATTPEQFEILLSEVPQRYRLLVLVAIETGVRWGELAALRPVDVNFETGEIQVRRVVLEVSKKITGADKVWSIRDYPKDNEHRTIRIGEQLCRDVREYLVATGKRDEDLLSSTSTGSPVSRTCSAPASGCLRSSVHSFASVCASTTYAARTPPGC